MNHDYAHCLDFKPDCPKECFRAQLTKELMEHPNIVPHGISTWSSFRGTEDCIRKEDDGI